MRVLESGELRDDEPCELRLVDGPLWRHGEWTAGEGRAGLFITREAQALLSDPSA